jgi:hypothetical protein
VCTKMHKQFSTMMYVNSIIWEIKVYKDTYCKRQCVCMKPSELGSDSSPNTEHAAYMDLHDDILMKKRDWCAIASHNWQDMSCDFGLNKLKLKRGNICSKTRGILKCHGVWRQYPNPEKTCIIHQKMGTTVMNTEMK